MNKPITVARQLFIEKMINDINESGLPFFVVHDAISSLLPELSKQADIQLENDRKAYNESIKNENTPND